MEHGHAESWVERDVPCVDCGYNLRGLPARDACPECGAPAERSLHGDLLVDANVSWLRSVTRGQELIAKGAAVMLAAWFMVLLLPLAALALESSTLALILLIAGAAVFAAGLLLAAIGTYWLTQAEPREAQIEIASTRHNRARRSATITVGVSACAMALPFLFHGGVISSRVLIWSGIAAGISWMFTVLASLDYMVQLAARIPDRSLVRGGRSRMKPMFLYFVVLAVVLLSLPALDCCAIPVLFIVMLLFVVELGLIAAFLQELARKLKVCLSEAEARTSAMSASPSPPAS